MNLNVDPVPIRLERPVGENTLKAVVEGTLAVPSGLPEVGRVVRIAATPRLGSSEAAADQVSLEGTLDVTLLYAAVNPGWQEADETMEEGEAADIFAPTESLYRVLWRRQLPFHGVVDLPGAEEGMRVVADLRVDEIRPAIAKGGRVLEVDAVLEAAVRCLQPEVVQVPQWVGDVGDSSIDVYREPLAIRSVSTRLQQQASVQGRLRLPSEAPPIERPLDVDVVCAVERVFVEDEGAQAEAVLDVHLAYAPGADSGAPVEFYAWQGEIPFTQGFFDESLADGQEGEVNARVLSVDVEVDGEGREVEIFADIELTLEVGGLRRVDVITEVASTDGEAAVETRSDSVSVETMAGTGEQVVDISGVVEVGEDYPPIDRLLAHEARATTDEVLVLGDKVSVLGHVDVSLLYIAREGEVENQVHFAEWKGAIPLETHIPVDGVHPPMRAHVDVELIDIAPDLLTRETVEWKGQVRATATVERTQEIEAVVEAVVVPPADPDPPTYTFLVVAPGDTLWKVSRRYGSSGEAIVAANPHLETVNDELVPGSKLCIPRRQPQALVPVLNGRDLRNGAPPAESA